MSVIDANQKLVNFRDESIMKLYNALQKYKQGLKYDIWIELVFQKSVVNDKGEMEKQKSFAVYRKGKIEELFKRDTIDDIEERLDKFIDNFWEFIEIFEQKGSGRSFMHIKGINLKYIYQRK